MNGSSLCAPYGCTQISTKLRHAITNIIFNIHFDRNPQKKNEKIVPKEFLFLKYGKCHTDSSVFNGWTFELFIKWFGLLIE